MKSDVGHFLFVCIDTLIYTKMASLKNDTYLDIWSSKKHSS